VRAGDYTAEPQPSFEAASVSFVAQQCYLWAQWFSITFTTEIGRRGPAAVRFVACD